MGVGIDKNRMLILLVLFWGHQRSQRHFLLQPCSIIHCMPGSRKGGGDGRDYALETTLPTKKKNPPLDPLENCFRPLCPCIIFHDTRWCFWEEVYYWVGEGEGLL